MPGLEQWADIRPIIEVKDGKPQLIDKKFEEFVKARGISSPETIKALIIKINTLLSTYSVSGKEIPTNILKGAEFQIRQEMNKVALDSNALKWTQVANDAHGESVAATWKSAPVLISTIPTVETRDYTVPRPDPKSATNIAASGQAALWAQSRILQDRERRAWL